jgi:hypothetical protein
LIDDINAAVPSYLFANKSDDFTAIFQANTARLEAQPLATPWPPATMARAANLDARSASRLRFELEPDSPNTEAVVAFLARTAPAGGESNKDGYKRAAEENDKRPLESQWPKRSMRKASGATSFQGADVEKKRSAKAKG